MEHKVTVYLYQEAFIWSVTGGHSLANVAVRAGVLCHEVLKELDVRVARSLHARTFISLFLCITDTCYISLSK